MWDVRICGVFLAVSAVLVCEAWTAPVGAPVEETGALVGGNTELAFDLYARLREAEGNLFFSPFSISAALAMTYGGARGRTEAQMARAMHFDLPQDRLHRAFMALNRLLQEGGTEEAFRLRLANALWGQAGYRFREEFLALTGENYDSGFREVDFTRATEQARRTINAWIAERTEGEIEELLRRGELDPEVSLVLTNVVHFRGRWAARFDEGLTGSAAFRINRKDEVMVPFMNRTGRFRFAAEGELELLELPYGGDRLSLVVLLPKAGEGLARLEESLNGGNLEGWLGRLAEMSVRVSLPRFRIDSRFDLSGTLQSLGMTDAFGNRADFSGITGKRDLFLSKVVHQARVEVNEEGTAAAAGSAVVLKKGPGPRSFAADHPFLFLIRDRQSGSILFLGRVVNPVLESS